MTTYLALFRGINIGGHNKVSMKEIVALFEDLNFKNISTYIQSGNVIFDTRRRSRSKLSSDISQGIFKRCGFATTVMLLTASELQDAIAHNPYPSDVGKALHFLFLNEPPKKPDLDRLTGLKTDSEDFMLGDKVFYLYTPEGFGRSKLAMNVERCLGVATTGRNWNTVSKLVAMMQ